MGADLVARNDDELLRVHASGQPEAAAAFEELVRRHGAAIHATCRRVLGSEAAAEDASQAVLLVLARSSGAVRGSLAAWLHRVAVNAARAALREESARKAREKEAAAMSRESQGAPSQAGWDDLRPHLDGEIDRLPAGERAAVVMHYLEGRPQNEVAKSLGVPEGTVNWRISKALERLRQRFARRNATLSAAALTAFLGGRVAEAACPAYLLAAAGKVGAAGAGAAGASLLGAKAGVIAKGAVKMMFWAKMKLVAAVACAAAVVGGGGSAVAVKLVASAGEPAKVESAADDKTIKCRVVEILHMALDRVRLSAGTEQGVREGFEFDVTSADGRQIATVKADAVEAKTCRALVTGGKFAEIKVGDLAETRLTVVGSTAAPPAKDAGEAVDGLRLTLSADRTELKTKERQLLRASPDEPRFDVEPAKLRFSFTNVGKEPLQLDAYDLVWSRLRLDVAGPDAASVKTIRRMVEREMMGRAVGDHPVLAADGTFAYPYQPTFPGNFGEFHYTLLKPGEYRLRVTYTGGAIPEKFAKAGTRAWTGKVASNEIVLRVLPPAAAGGEAVDGLRLALSAGPTELRLLPANRDRSPVGTGGVWQQARLEFVFTNVGTEVLQLDAYDLVWSRLKLEVTGPDAGSVQTVRVKELREMSAPRAESYPALAPDAKFIHDHDVPTFPGQFGALLHTLVKPGEYRIKVTYASREIPKEFAKEGARAWTGKEVISNEIVIKVLPSEPQAGIMAPVAPAPKPPAPAPPSEIF